MTINELCEKMKMMQTEFPILRKTTFVEADFHRIVSDADLTALVDPDIMEEAQRKEKERFSALPYNTRTTASEKNFHDREMEKISNRLITDALKDKFDFISGVHQLHGGSGKWEITVA